MKKMVKRLLVVILSCVLMCMALPAIITKAESNSVDESYRTVRIGWYQSAMFQEGLSDDEIKSGYCYDYLQKVADYTSWRFEYVYGGWEELFQKLQTGEIDFLGGVSDTTERRKTMLFPEYAMGTDQYYLYKRADDNTINPSDLNTLNGKVLGGIGNNRMTVLAEQWIKDNNLDIEIVYFKDFIEQEEAFESGKIDLFVQTMNNVLNINNIDIVSKMGEESFYLAVSKDKPELLSELNNSLSKMLSIDPFILQNLQYKNYGANFINKSLSESEMEWIENNKKLIIGYLDNYMPYSDTDKEGNATGLMTDVLPAVINAVGLEDTVTVKYRAFKNYDDMIEALNQREISIAFPVNGNMWDLERDGVNASSEVVISSEALFYKGTYKREKIKKVAINRNNNLQLAYCRRSFPEAEIIFASSIEESLDMVLDGRANGTIINTLRTELVTRNSKYNTLSYIQLEVDDSRCFGVNEGNVELLSILNRGMRVVGSTYGIENAYKYMESFYQYDIVDLLRDNFVPIIVVLGAIFFSVVALLVMALRIRTSEVKQKEELIREANELNKRIESLKDKADRANEAKTLFLNNMSHDIRTPMNAILGYTDIAGKQTDNPKVKEYLDKIHNSSEHLLSLINDVLDISRIESGNVTITPVNVDIEHVTDEAINIVNGFLTGRDLEFEVKKDVKASPHVAADSLKIREILVNLLGNAVKFTDDGGKISLTFELTDKNEGVVNARYIVADTGKGMSEEFQKHIFEEFAQESNGARTQYKGTGLGMTITKKYIDMMNGTISFVSRQGEGTTFTVDIPMPIVDVQSDEEHSTTTINHDVSGTKILLAEDNDLNAEIAGIQLNEVGIIVTRVSDGAEAVECFRNHPADSFDLILMDIMMPNMNGYEATEAIRSISDRPDGKEIPIIAMTANAFSEDIKKSFEAGMTEHITKPIEPEELIMIISQVVKNR